MSTAKNQLTVSNLVVDVVRKDIKNLHLAVYPPHGRVRIAVPLLVDDDAVRLAVVAKLGWIKRQQARFAEQKRQSPREYVTGESHYFQGQRYLLNVIYENVTPCVEIRNHAKIDLYVRPQSDRIQRERVMLKWYRQQLREVVPPLLEKWEGKIGVETAAWGIRHMKTKWGTCNIEARRIWLNLELIKKPTRCLEYIIVHELVHLHERHHNNRFTALMDNYMSDWRLLRDELNREPLTYDHWEY